MNPLTRLAIHLGERITHTTDTDLIAAGYTVHTTPDGHRTVRRADTPAIAETHREATLRRGLDPADRALMDPQTLRALHATADRLNRQRQRQAA